MVAGESKKVPEAVHGVLLSVVKPDIKGPTCGLVPQTGLVPLVVLAMLIVLYSLSVPPDVPSMITETCT